MKKDELYFNMMMGLSIVFLFFLTVGTLLVLSQDRNGFVLYSLSLLSLILIIVLFFLRRRKKNAWNLP